MSYTEEEVSVAWENVLNDGLGDWSELDPYTKNQFLTFANELFTKRKGEPIEANNIRVGDKIERVNEVSDGVTVTFSGVVGRINDYGNIYTEEDGYIANIRDTGTFHLLHRPVPKIEVGQVIRVDEVSNAEAYGLVGREFSVVYIEGNVVDVLFPGHKWSALYLDDIAAFTVLWPTEESK